MTIVQDFFIVSIAEKDLIEFKIAKKPGEHFCANCGVIFLVHFHQLLCSGQTGKCFGQLATDISHLYDGYDHKTEDTDKGKKFTGGEFATGHIIATDSHDSGRSQP
mgnify:CR=1 FL=1